ERTIQMVNYRLISLALTLPDSQLYYLVDASYQQAVNALSEDKRKQLPQS
ncbi:MmcQ/YjbR family DNA-binding protein, partial [Salmonella enterica]|nr:MmcQ/YjbR family DNA-binding protein [Salmonella enterica]EKH6854657.1 MmcQ/YjbR family DNA-binding protein [Salmonella enterica]EKH6919973.1 MmcQ/YjbR family DNA-binding protein [Salmonella enterica]EKI0538215.1 MmcQ/YjbR family DNA-binding protein [Salmonella enterica]EKI3595102.1 MmcQ/YjbR family DNA-binding protein [Salmonella enterica]